MKYKLAEKKFFPELNRELWQIEAVDDFGNVKKGERGGWVEREDNLSQDGNAWVYGNAEVYDNARVSGNAEVCGNAWVSDNAEAYGNARVFDSAEILVLGKLGNSERFITCTPDKSHKMQIACGCFLGGIDAFEKAVRKKYGDDPNSDYMLIMPLLRKKEAEWAKGKE